MSDYVIEGDGPVVKDTDSVVVKFNGKTWKDDKSFESTYTSDQTVTWPLGELSVKGLKDGLVGKKAGSRILLVIPRTRASGTRSRAPSRRSRRWSSASTSSP